MNEPLPQWVALIIGPVSFLLLVALFIFVYRRQSPSDRTAVRTSPPVPDHEQTQLAPWVVPSTACLNAYIQRDYAACVLAGRKTLALQFVPTIGLVTILALRRLERDEEAEDLGRELLLQSWGPGGMFIDLMRLLDGYIEPDHLLRQRVESEDSIGITPELECQVHFYWGAKLLTEGAAGQAASALSLSLQTNSDALERSLAHADLKSAIESLPITNQDESLPAKPMDSRSHGCS